MSSLSEQKMAECGNAKRISVVGMGCSKNEERAVQSMYAS